jgi:purine nucleosidase
VLTYPPIRRTRLIIDTDAKNEADDQYAITQAMLSPSLEVRGIIAAHFGARPGRSMTSMLDSKAEAELILELLGMTGRTPVLEGAPHAIPDFRTAVDSPGARFIIEESLRDDDRPLFLAFLGPLTNLASALILDPGLAERDVTVVWIGGADRDNSMEPSYWPEFNLSNDIAAANVVFASGMRIQQIPLLSYVGIGVSYAELLDQISDVSPLGEYLVRQLFDWNAGHAGDIENRALCDCGAIAAILYPWCGDYEDLPARRFEYDGGYGDEVPGKTVRVYRRMDARFILSDLFAKIRLHARGIIPEPTNPN